MFALIETELVAAESFFRRLKLFLPRGYNVRSDDYLRYMHVSIDYPVNVKESERIRRTGNALEAVRKMNISSVVVPEGFQYMPLVNSAGLTAHNPMGLYKRLAGRLAATLLSSHREARSCKLAVIDFRATPDFYSVVEHCKSITDSIAIWCGNDTEAFAFGLRRYEGIIALTQENPVADVYVLLSLPKIELRVPENAVVVNLTGKDVTTGGRVFNCINVQPPMKLRPHWPWHCDTPSLLAAMVHCGLLGINDIIIE